MKKIALLLTIALFCGSFSGVAYAKDSDKKIETDNILQIGARNAEVKDIILNEAEAGLFKKGKTIYLQAEHLQFEKGAKAEVIKGDIQLKEIQTEGDIMKITIEKESTVPSEIKMKEVALFLDGSLPDGTYSLRLITESGDRYPHNLFGELYSNTGDKDTFVTSYVTMIENFVTLMTEEESEVHLEGFAVTVGGNEFRIRNKSILIEKPYIVDGRVMLPVRDIVEALSDQAIIKWDEKSHEVTIMLNSRIVSINLEGNTINLNGVITPMLGKSEIRDGKTFLPMRDLGYALGVNDTNIKWNQETQTATFY